MTNNKFIKETELDTEEINNNNDNPFLKIKNDYIIAKDLSFNKLNKSEQDNLEKDILNTLNLYNYYTFDIELHEKVINKYKLNQLIYQPVSLFFTTQNKKLEKNCRFSVFSYEIEDISDEESMNNNNKDEIGLSISKIADNFKVIDIYKKEDKTQITLLNYPILNNKIFKDHETKLEKELMKKSRELFDESFNKEVLKLGMWSELFEQKIGLHDFYGQYTFFTEEDMILLLEILSKVCDDYGFNETIQFVHENDMIALINSYHENIENENSSEKENIKKETINNLVNVIETGINLSSDIDFSKNDVKQLSNEEKALLLNEAIKELGKNSEGIIKIKDEENNNLLPMLNLLDPIESFIFLRDIIGEWDLELLKGYNKNKMNELIENKKEDQLILFLQENENKINEIIQKKLKKVNNHGK